MLLLQAPTIPAKSSRNLQRVFLRCLFPAHERDTSCVGDLNFAKTEMMSSIVRWHGCDYDEYSTHDGDTVIF